MAKKLWILFGVFASAGFPAAAQTRMGTDSLFMTHAQNRRWLIALKEQRTADQWGRIRNRYFSSPQGTSSPHGEVNSLPLLLVEGLAVDVTRADDPVREIVATQLTPAKVKAITVIEREPEGVYVNKASTGWIVITLADKSLRKVLRRMGKRAQQPLAAD